MVWSGPIWPGLTCTGAVDGSIVTHIIHAEDPGAQQVLIGAVGRSVGRRPADKPQQNNDCERTHPCYSSTADRQWWITGVIADRKQGYKRVSFSSFRAPAALKLCWPAACFWTYTAMIIWHESHDMLVSERSVRSNAITPTKTHSSCKQAHLILSHKKLTLMTNMH